MHKLVLLITDVLHCSGKTVDEVWNAIKSNQTQTSYDQPFTVGHLLEGLSAVSDNPRDPILAAQLQCLPQQYAHSQPEAQQPHMQQLRLPDPPQLQIHPQSGLTPPFYAPLQYASHHGQNGQPMKMHQSPVQPYVHPQQAQHAQHQRQFEFPPPSVHPHQQLPPPANLMPIIQASPVGRMNQSPPKAQQGSPNKGRLSENGVMDIRASSHYPPAQQVSSGHSMGIITLL